MNRQHLARTAALSAAAALALTTAPALADDGAPAARGGGGGSNTVVLENQAEWDVIAYSLEDGTQRGVTFAEAALGPQTDAFDGAGFILVNGDQVTAPAVLRERGGEVRSEENRFGKLRVRTAHSVVKKSAVGRVVVTLTNPTNKARSADVQWYSNLGSDSSTTIFGTSSGNSAFTDTDRWVISDDSGIRRGEPISDDPAVTQVFAGRGDVAPRSDAVGESESGDFAVTTRVKVPAKSTRYLVFFVGLSTDAAEAADDVEKLDAKKPPKRFLSGFSKKQRGRIANWDL